MIPTATGVITNTASVSGDELDPDPSDNTVTQTTFVSGVDLSIAKTDDPDPVLVGDALTYTLAVTNNGPSISAGVTTTDVLPSSVVFVSVTSTAAPAPSPAALSVVVSAALPSDRRSRVP